MNPQTGIILSITVLLGMLAVSEADNVPPIEGTWLSGDGDGWIRITVAGDRLSGVVHSQM